MFTFFNFDQFFKTLCNLFHNVPQLWYSFFSFAGLFFAILGFFITRLFWREARGVNPTFCVVLAQIYVFVDIYLCMSVTPRLVWQFAHDTLYGYCLTKYLLLMLLYAVICLQGAFKPKRCAKKEKEERVNSTWMGYCPQNQRPTNWEAERSTPSNWEDHPSKPTNSSHWEGETPKNPRAKIEERIICSNGGVQASECYVRKLDLNVGYCLSVIQAVEQKNITQDEREFLQQLKLKIRQAYSSSPEQLKHTDEGLGALLKLVAKYEAL